MEMKILAYFDGAIQPCNPNGFTGYGGVINVPGNPPIELYGYVSSGEGMTVNVGEASGLIAVLQTMLDRGLQKEDVVVRGDSQCILKSLVSKNNPKGVYAPYLLKAKKIAKQFKNIQFQWVRREQNVEADRLSKKSIEDKDLSVFKKQRKEFGAEHLSAIQKEI